MTTFLFQIYLAFLEDWANRASAREVPYIELVLQTHSAERPPAKSIRDIYGPSIDCRGPPISDHVSTSCRFPPKVRLRDNSQILVRKFPLFLHDRNREKKTARSGFEASTLSLTGTSWDWRSRPLDHHSLAIHPKLYAITPARIMSINSCCLV